MTTDTEARQADTTVCCSDDPRSGCAVCEEAGRLGICVGCDRGCYCGRELHPNKERAR